MFYHFFYLVNILYFLFIYFLVHGQIDMQMPQVPSVTSNILPLSTTVLLHIFAFNKCSLSAVISHKLPVIAFPYSFVINAAAVEIINASIEGMSEDFPDIETEKVFDAVLNCVRKINHDGLTDFTTQPPPHM